MFAELLSYVSPEELRFFFALCLSILAGLIMGIERETRHKDAGISTHILVVSGAMLFTFLSDMVEPENSARIAAQIVSGIGFLGAGLIIKEGASVRNLTTAASLWFAAAIGMSFGFGFYLIGMVCALFGVFIPRIPHLKEKVKCLTCGSEDIKVGE